MEKRLIELGFTIYYEPSYSGSMWYQCPKGHIINYFLEPHIRDYKCPVCAGKPNTIAGELHKLIED